MKYTDNKPRRVTYKLQPMERNPQLEDGCLICIVGSLIVMLLLLIVVLLVLNIWKTL